MLVALTLAIAESGSVRLLQPTSTAVSRQPLSTTSRVSLMLGTRGTWQKNVVDQCGLQAIERRARSVGALSELIEDGQVSGLQNGARAAVAEDGTDDSGMGGAEAVFRRYAALRAA